MDDTMMVGASPTVHTVHWHTWHCFVFTVQLFTLTIHWFWCHHHHQTQGSDMNQALTELSTTLLVKWTVLMIFWIFWYKKNDKVMQGKEKFYWWWCFRVITVTNAWHQNEGIIARFDEYQIGQSSQMRAELWSINAEVLTKNYFSPSNRIKMWNMAAHPTTHQHRTWYVSSIRAQMLHCGGVS